MAMGNPRIHIICGICGNNKVLSFYIKKELNDDTNKLEDKVTIVCNNCDSITGLEELIEQENPEE